MQKQQIRLLPYMPHDDFQTLLEKYYKYGQGWVTRWSHRLRIECIRDLIDSYIKVYDVDASSPLKALDVGCGKGAYAYLCGQRGLQTFGLDISREEISEAREWTSANFVLGNAEKLPFKDNSFDLVVCSEVIEHLDNSAIGVVEIQRVLKSGGVAIISIPNEFSYYWLGSMAKTSAGLYARGRFRISNSIDAHMKFPYWRTRSLVKQAGLRILSATSVFFYFPLMGLNIQNIPSTTRAFAQWLEKILRKIPLIRNFGGFYILVGTKI